MDALSFLREDHRNLQQLFEQVEGSASETTRGELVEQIRSATRRHLDVEDGIFYPALRTRAEGDSADLAARALEQHRRIGALLAELDGVHPGDQAFDAKLRALLTQTRAHMDIEDTGVLTAAEALLPDDELVDLGRRMDERARVMAAQDELTEAVTRPLPAREMAVLAGAAVLGLVVLRLLGRRRRRGGSVVLGRDTVRRRR